MYNPRNSLISTSSTYPSTLSPIPSLNGLPTPPASPRHPARLHRSPGRHLRASASVVSLKPIDEGLPGLRKEREESGRGNIDIPESLRPSSTGSARLASPNVTASQTGAAPATSTSRPKSSLQVPKQTERVQKKQSTDQLRSSIPPKPQSTSTGLGLTDDSTHTTTAQVKPVQAIAQPKRPKPIDVNPRKESMADEWERELIHSAKNLHIGMAQQQSTGKGKGKGKGNDLEWERAGTWQEDDPIREAEDRTRRDAKGERAFPPERPRAPIRAGSNGVTSVHIGVRPRLHPSRADTSMTLNQPDGSLAPPLGSPLSESQAHNLAAGSTNLKSANYTDEKLQKAQAEYEEWLSRKEERELGVGHPHDYSTRDWASKGRVPARPAALGSVGEGSTMPQPIPAQVPRQVPQMAKVPVSNPPPIQAPAPIPILVHADPDVQRPVRDSVLVTPVNMPTSDQMVQAVSHDPAYLGGPSLHRPGTLSSQPSMENVHAQYMYGQEQQQISPYGLPPGVDPMAAWQYQYPYPYDPSYGYAMDPAMYQYWNPGNSWYGAQYNLVEQDGKGGEAQSVRASKVHFDDAPSGGEGDIPVKGIDPYTEDQYDP